MNASTVLFVDPDVKRYALVVDHLRSLGFVLLVAEAPGELDPRGQEARSAAVAVVGLPGDNGRRVEMVRSLRQADPNLVLVCGIEPDPEAEAEALAAGADEIVRRPYSPAQVESAVRLGLEVRRLREEACRFQALAESRHSFGDLIGGSQPMVSLYQLLEQVASSDAPALIQAEPGTEVAEAAAAIHARSARRHGILQRLEAEQGSAPDVARLAEENGRAPEAGTLWLSDIERLGLEAQSALLDRLNAYGALGPWRLIASTERDLMGLAREGAFLRDLYYRINVFPVRIPPLRERIEDLPLLAADRLRRMAGGRAGAKRLTYRALLILTSQSWPGNVAELDSALREAAERRPARDIEPEDLPAQMASEAAACSLVAPGRSLRQAKEDFEREYFRALLAHTRGNMSLASKISKVGRPYLYKKTREHGLDPADFRWA